MKKLTFENIISDCEKLIVELGGNALIAEIRIAGAMQAQNLSIKYAQNDITSDLIALNCEPTWADGALVYDFKSPVCASQIFIFGSDLQNLNVTMYQSDSLCLDCYPQCYDFDHSENCYINGITVQTKGEGYADFDVYTSLDGRDFRFAGAMQAQKVGDECKINVDNREGRIVRVYLKYCTVHDGCKVSDVTVSGEKSATPIKARPEIKTVDFKDSKYNVKLTPKDTVAEVYGIIERTLGGNYKNWFILELCESANGHDFYEISYVDGKIHIKGNSGVCLACGLNYYLKYFCKVNISQVGSQIAMPSAPATLQKPIYKETKAKVRYAYNYCTLSYTMAFWGEAEWQKELDWLALNGVNLVLDTTAQEEVWRRFLDGIGYTHKDIKDFLVGPAYFAWAYMANTTKIGGPLHDSWFESRTELARKNQLYMRKMGMMPILQGFSGMMPLDIKKYDHDIESLSRCL